MHDTTVVRATISNKRRMRLDNLITGYPTNNEPVTVVDEISTACNAHMQKDRHSASKGFVNGSLLCHQLLL